MKNVLSALPILSAAHSASLLPNVMDTIRREGDDTGVSVVTTHLPVLPNAPLPGLTF